MNENRGIRNLEGPSKRHASLFAVGQLPASLGCRLSSSPPRQYPLNYFRFSPSFFVSSFAALDLARIYPPSISRLHNGRKPTIAQHEEGSCLTTRRQRADYRLQVRRWKESIAAPSIHSNFETIASRRKLHCVLFCRHRGYILATCHSSFDSACLH